MMSRGKVYKNKDFFWILGKISLFFATADYFAILITKRIVGENRLKDVVQLNPNATLSQKFDWITKLNSELVVDTEIFDDLKKVIEQAAPLCRERNRYIHDQWEFNEENMSSGNIRRIHIINTPRDIKFSVEELTISDLYSFQRKIGNLQKELFAINERLKDLSKK